jgi:hypothetical protein
MLTAFLNVETKGDGKRAVLHCAERDGAMILRDYSSINLSYIFMAQRTRTGERRQYILNIAGYVRLYREYNKWKSV